MTVNNGRTYICEACGEGIDDEDDPTEVKLNHEGQKIHVECWNEIYRTDTTVMTVTKNTLEQ